MLPLYAFLGTTYSAVAVYRNFSSEVLINDQGNRLTPSCVAYTNEELLVGETALQQASMNPNNTILGRYLLLCLFL